MPHCFFFFLIFCRHSHFNIDFVLGLFIFTSRFQTISFPQSLSLNCSCFFKSSFKGKEEEKGGTRMDNIGETTNKQHVMKVEIVSSETTEMIMSGTMAQPMLTRQTSATKNTCLCSPTTHAGSFRCRLHRTPSLQRTNSIDDSAPSSLQDSPLPPPPTSRPTNGNTKLA